MAQARTTELQSVNVLLDVIGESPISDIEVSGNVLVSKARACLDEFSRDVQERGWHFNREEDFTMVRDVDNRIPLAPNVLKVDSYADDVLEDVVQRGDWLYDRTNHTYVFTKNIVCTVVWYLAFDELPEAARRYITIKAARAFQERVLGSDALNKFTADDELSALTSMNRAELSAGDFNAFSGSWSVAQTLRRRPYR